MDKTASTLLNEIKDATGWSEIRIADEIGTSQPTVNRILKGQPNCYGTTHIAIINLHEKVCVAAVRKINRNTRRSTDNPS